jgi:hypothetical protein
VWLSIVEKRPNSDQDANNNSRKMSQLQTPESCSKIFCIGL